MATFFSGTDTRTLQEIGVDYPHFVSLIVNNRGIYTAAITRRIQANCKITKEYSYPTFGAKSAQGVVVETTGNEIMEYFLFDITIEGADNSIELRFDEIRKAHEEEAKKLVSHDMATGEIKTFYGSPVFGGKSYRKLAEDSYGDGYDFKEEAPWSNHKSEKGTKKEEPEEEPKVLDETDAPIEYSKFKNPKVSEIEHIVRQLLTASIIIPNGSKVDLNKWVKAMPNLFSKRFETIHDFENFAVNYVDFLVGEIPSTEFYEECEEDDSICMAVIAYYVKAALEEYVDPKHPNAYLDTYIKLLNDYII